MAARDHLRLGPDGKYIWVENPDAEDAQGAGSASRSESPSASPSASTSETSAEPSSGNVGRKGAGRADSDAKVLTTISSSMSGPGIGDDVAAKRASLIHAQGTPQIGRRESPEPYDPKPTRMMYARGLLAGLVVIVIVLVIVVVLGVGSDIY